jgi:hypothetical protein
MYRIPKNFDLSKLRGKTISQVAFTINTISLYIENGNITFSGGFSLFTKKGILERHEVYPVQGDFGLIDLIEREITEAQTNNEDNELIIRFQDDTFLTLYGNENYESYSITLDGQEIIV